METIFLSMIRQKSPCISPTRQLDEINMVTIPVICDSFYPPSDCDYPQLVNECVGESVSVRFSGYHLEVS